MHIIKFIFYKNVIIDIFLLTNNYRPIFIIMKIEFEILKQMYNLILVIKNKHNLPMTEH